MRDGRNGDRTEVCVVSAGLSVTVEQDGAVFGMRAQTFDHKSKMRVSDADDGAGGEAGGRAGGYPANENEITILQGGQHAAAAHPEEANQRRSLQNRINRFE